MTTTYTKFEIYFRVYKNGLIKVIQGPGNYYLTEEEKQEGNRSIGESFNSGDEEEIIYRPPDWFEQKHGFRTGWTMRKEPSTPGLYYGQATLSVSVCYIPGEPTDYDHEFILDSFVKVDKIITRPRILRFIDPYSQRIERMMVIAK